MQHEAVSVVVERKVLPGKQAEFEKILKGIIQACSRWKGYLGTHVTKPTNNDNKYLAVFRFDSQENLNAWIHSQEREDWVVQIDHLIEEPTSLQFITGLETWFTLPGKPILTPPPRYKMAIVTWLAITPLLICFSLIFGEYLSQFPVILRFFLTTPWIVLIMTYLWMPFMTKMFRRWLYP